MMKKKLQTRKEQLQIWFQNETEKDKLNLENEKNNFIEEIKKLKKEDLLPKEEKLNIWQRIKKTLVG
jgi:hypothetical protein